MHSALRQKALLNNAELVLKRALPNQNVTITYATTAASQLAPPSRRNIQTTSMLWTAQHEQNADRLISRESLNPSRAESTGTGTDDEVASHDASFDPHNTAPESEIEATGRESEARKDTSNPLDVSPGNIEVNKTRDPSKDPPESGADRPASSRGWTRKSKPEVEDSQIA
ncbi:conserved hypothetical protein [Talaromyces stipitatus ATCC 10500]|uniref:Uncharacterized protein n=1 Tax=Talaromyces stipitatus (strain ATCC 10500 / CBS 375.48 / QM 6759 / NRRL 1006) TaxID=441959 RepID=B8LYQ9_TALSN|nr:uncharacterized protein TSTA_068440 [Talaromyces stipitatus ATCC 10500]EED23417.1 conserved hypothetical protein [Talaromyces stipitatus ATCC 10500]